LSKKFSGLNPNMRNKIEKTIIDALTLEEKLTTSDLRSFIKSHNLVNGVPLTQRRLARLCTSLIKEGKITSIGKIRKRKVWSLKQY